MTSSAVLETESTPSTASRYEALIRIAASLRAQPEPRKLFDILAHELGQVVQFDAIAQFDERSDKMHWHLCPGCVKPKAPSSEIDKEQTLAAWVFRNQKTVVIANLADERRFPVTTSLMIQAGLQSVCAFPLSTAHRHLGSLVIASVHRGAY